MAEENDQNAVQPQNYLLRALAIPKPLEFLICPSILCATGPKPGKRANLPKTFQSIFTATMTRCGKRQSACA